MLLQEYLRYYVVVALLLARHALGPAPDEADDVERRALLAIRQLDQAVLVIVVGSLQGVL